MRAAWLVCLVGCYQPNSEAPCTVSCTTICPAHLRCRAGWCTGETGPTCGGDGGVVADGDQDASGRPLCAMPTATGIETQVTAGEWFTARLVDETYAVKFAFEVVPEGTFGAIRGTRLDPSGIYTKLVGDDNEVEYRSPHLAPDGLEMFLRMHATTANTWSLVRFQRTATTDTWSLPQLITVANAPPIEEPDDPSSPTTTSPRRMVVSRSGTGFAEIAEVSATAWQVVQLALTTSYTTDDAKTVAFLGQAHLTEDGRRLVFRGQVNGELVSAYYLERASIGSGFASPARRIPTQSSVGQPFMTSDCKNLFYRRAAEGFIYRVVYP